MKCPKCNLNLIPAVNTDGMRIILVPTPNLFGSVWGHNKEVEINGDIHERVRPLLGTRMLHEEVCSFFSRRKGEEK